MVLMNMYAFSFSGHKRTTENTSTWRVGSADMREIQFPQSVRIAQLWQETVKDGGELVVIDEQGSNYRGVEIPRGIKPPRRQPFLDALGKEVTAV